jgi:hypothetical protein
VLQNYEAGDRKEGLDRAPLGRGPKLRTHTPQRNHTTIILLYTNASVCVHACMFAREGCWGIRVCAIVRDGENSPHFYKSFFVFGFLVAFVEEKLHFI